MHDFAVPEVERRRLRLERGRRHEHQVGVGSGVILPKRHRSDDPLGISDFQRGRVDRCKVVGRPEFAGAVPPIVTGQADRL